MENSVSQQNPLGDGVERLGDGVERLKMTNRQPSATHYLVRYVLQ